MDLKDLLKRAAECPDEPSLDELSKELIRAGFPRPEREKKTVILVALGPNKIQIPCMVFETRDDAEKFCEKIFEGPYTEKPHWGSTRLSEGVEVYVPRRGEAHPSPEFDAHMEKFSEYLN